MSLRGHVEPGWTLAVAASNRPDLRIVFYPDGVRRFWHTCTILPMFSWEAPSTIECAPTLQHEVTVRFDEDVLVTVTPSILCERCDLHGWFTANVWTDA